MPFRGCAVDYWPALRADEEAAQGLRTARARRSRRSRIVVGMKKARVGRITGRSRTSITASRCSRRTVGSGRVKRASQQSAKTAAARGGAGRMLAACRVSRTVDGQAVIAFKRRFRFRRLRLRAGHVDDDWRPRFATPDARHAASFHADYSTSSAIRDGRRLRAGRASAAPRPVPPTSSSPASAHRQVVTRCLRRPIRHQASAHADSRVNVIFPATAG